MDFIKQLPESKGFTNIPVVIDRLTKQATFIPTKRTIDTVGLVELFIQDIFSKYGVPNHITSDKDSKFVLRFFRLLANTLNIRLHFTSGYHPEANSQTEYTNKMLEQYLRIFCTYQQSDWLQLLLLAEFTFNNTPSVTMDMSLFFMNKAYYPKLEIQSD